MRGINSLVLLTIVFIALAGSAMGGLIGGSQNEDYPKISSSIIEADVGSRGDFGLVMDPKDVNLENASWSFYRDYWEPSQWHMICSLWGYHDTIEPWPQDLSWQQEKTLANFHVWTGINLYVKKYSEKADPEMTIIGQFSLSTVDVKDSRLFYQECEQEFWEWDEATETHVMKMRPAWHAEYQVRGNFVAPTLAEARAIGMNFPAQPVPEPSSTLMIGIGALSIAGVLFIKRRK